MNTSELVEWGGIFLIIVLIFAETGLLLGLVIPGGETLVFTSGLLVSTGVLHIDPFVLLAVLIAAGFIGDVSGYLIGRKMGSKVHEKEDTWYFKKKYLHVVEDFFKRHKKRSIIIGKFLPVIRPFTPVTAGISKMDRKVFFGLSILSAVLYMSIFLLAGYYLGNSFPQIKNYLHWILPATVLLLVVPVLLKIRKDAKKQS